MDAITDLDSLTPLMRQYHAIKQNYADALLLFQVGDFYELFFDDAQKAAQCLGIALTKRGSMHGEPIPLCGVPMHAIDHYLARLVKAGFKIALCDQLEEPKPGNVVRRGVTQVITPGTLIESKLLDAKKANYLFSFFPDPQGWGICVSELLTAQLFATVIPCGGDKHLESELHRFFPDEILMRSSHIAFQQFFKQRGYFISSIDECNEAALAQWLQQFPQITQQTVLENKPLHGSITTLHHYLKKNQENSLAQFATIQFYSPEDFLKLDSTTQRNLELIKNNYDGSSSASLFSVLDGAQTAMGSRMIKKWIVRPLMVQESIEQRLEAVDFLVHHIKERKELSTILQEIGDLERVIGRIGLRRASLHDYYALKTALSRVPDVKKIIGSIPHALMAFLHQGIQDFSDLQELLDQSLQDWQLSNAIIKKGYNAHLDSLRDYLNHGAQKILELERHEQQETGINSLKIRYTSTFGYYIEITKTHMHAVPDRYVRRQTLVGRERYTSLELQKLEHALSTATKDAERLEQEIYEQIKNQVFQRISSLRKLVHALANIDAILGFAYVAYENNYTKPTFTSTGELYIEKGRHPVVEQTLKNKFIANDTLMNDAQSLWLVTGPNMGGKSTYLRQVALITLMAHLGSFVPAKSASLPIVDRIFTRIGAGDNLADGKSTFLVEMEETAAICALATRKSLIILDEVGRGTSTFDGLALAQAVVEYLHTQIHARCLFATHYHELTALSAQYTGIVNYYMASKKTNGGITFLYTITRGIADGSFGLEVAKIAGLPHSVIERASYLLDDLKMNPQGQKSEEAQQKIPLSAIDKRYQAVMENIDSIDWDRLSPKASFDLLWKIKELQG